MARLLDSQAEGNGAGPAGSVDLTPGAVRELAAQLGINLHHGHELVLLPVAYHLSVAPPPPPWHRLTDENGRTYYHNKRLRASQWVHPKLEAARRLVDYLRDVHARASGRTDVGPEASFANQGPFVSIMDQPALEHQGDSTTHSAPPQQQTAEDAAAAAEDNYEDVDYEDAEANSPAKPAPGGAGAAVAGSGAAGRDSVPPGPPSPSSMDAGVVGTVPRKACLAFRDPEGMPFYYNFALQTEVDDASPDQVMDPLPPALLQRFGLAGPGSGMGAGGSGTTISKPLRKLTFYSWWLEDNESTDLTRRVSSNSECGGGLLKRYATLEYDLQSGFMTITLTSPDQDVVINVPPMTPARSYPSTPSRPRPSASFPTSPVAGEGAAAASRAASRHSTTASPTRLQGGSSSPGELSATALQSQSSAPHQHRLEVWDLHVGAAIDVLGRRMTLHKASGETQRWHAQREAALTRLRDEVQDCLQLFRPHRVTAAVGGHMGAVKHAAGVNLRHLAAQAALLVKELQQYRPSKAAQWQRTLDALGVPPPPA